MIEKIILGITILLTIGFTFTLFINLRTGRFRRESKEGSSFPRRRESILC